MRNTRKILFYLHLYVLYKVPLFNFSISAYICTNESGSEHTFSHSVVYLGLFIVSFSLKCLIYAA